MTKYLKTALISASVPSNPKVSQHWYIRPLLAESRSRSISTLDQTVTSTEQWLIGQLMV